MSAPLTLTAELLLSAYSAGIFPMGSEDDDEILYWVDPPQRGVLPLSGLSVSRSLRKVVRQDRFEVRINADFDGTMRDCADRDETWINAAILRIYNDLHHRGFAHSVECWRGGERVGGLYGVSLGAAFFGESMFSRESDASKVALVHLVARLRFGGYGLLDTQFTTAHLESLGAREIARRHYRERLRRALEVPAQFHALDTDVGGARVLELALP